MTNIKKWGVLEQTMEKLEESLGMFSDKDIESQGNQNQGNY